MKRSAVFMAGVFVAFALAGSAQGTQPVTIDLEQAIRIALSENPTIRIADLEIERQDYVRKETWGNLLPQLAATVGYNNALIKSEMASGISFEPTHTVNFGGQLNLPLVVPGVYQSLKLNKEQMRAAVETARGSRITMACEVKKAFYNILRVDQEIAVLRASRDNVQQTVDQIRVSNQNGLASEYDLLTAEVQLSNLTPTILQAEQGRQVAAMYLKMLMGMPLEQEVLFKGNLRELGQAMADMPLGADLTNNSDLRSLEIQESILQRQIKLLRTQRMPTLGATISGNLRGNDPVHFDMAAMSGGAMGWQTNGSYVGQPYGVWSPVSEAWTLVPPAADAPMSNAFTWQHPVALSVGLSVPIFAGFTKTNKEKQVKNNLQQLRTQRGYVEQQLEVQANTAVGDVYTAREKMLATSKTVTQARKAYEISNVRYKAGAGTILELNSAELQLTQAQLNYTQAVYTLLAAQADYGKILGNE